MTLGKPVDGDCAAALFAQAHSPASARETTIFVSVKFAEATEDRPRAISSIGIELYGPLPGGVALGGRFAPEVVKVRGLREIPIEAATRPTR